MAYINWMKLQLREFWVKMLEKGKYVFVVCVSKYLVFVLVKKITELFCEFWHSINWIQQEQLFTYCYISLKTSLVIHPGSSSYLQDDCHSWRLTSRQNTPELYQMTQDS